MINQEEALHRYLTGALRAQETLTVLQLKISLIDESLRRDELLTQILTSLYDVLALYGQAFCLKNDDIFIVYNNKINENTVRAALIKMWMHFSADRKTERANQLLEKTYKLPLDKEAVQYEIKRIANGPSRISGEINERPKFTALPVIEKDKKLFTPEMLSRVSKALQNTDFSNIIRRQPVCIVLADTQPQPLFEEVFVSIDDLGESTLPGVSLTATPWLFQDLTETLDKRVLNSVSLHDDGAFTHDFSLNLNISTILSDEFRYFDEGIHSTSKNTIVLELQPPDVFSDLRSYLKARDLAQNLGYKVCIDSVTMNTFKFIDRERLSADYIKLVWNQNLPFAIQDDAELAQRLENTSPNRLILCRVDNEDALAFGAKYGITLFQGRYIQHVLSKDLRNRRVGTTLLHKY